MLCNLADHKVTCRSQWAHWILPALLARWHLCCISLRRKLACNHCQWPQACKHKHWRDIIFLNDMPSKWNSDHRRRTGACENVEFAWSKGKMCCWCVKIWSDYKHAFDCVRQSSHGTISLCWEWKWIAVCCFQKSWHKVRYTCLHLDSSKMAIPCAL